MNIFWVVAVAYLLIGLVFILRSRSRGFVADMLFASLWPVYLAIYIATGK